MQTLPDGTTTTEGNTKLTVWIVEECVPYEGCWVKGVFDTEEGANEWLEAANDYMLTITEYELNPPLPQ